MSRDLIDTIPSARNIQSIGALVPGIRLNIPDVGGAQQTEQTYMATHGNAALHNTMLLDGMPAQTNLVDGAGAELHRQRAHRRSDLPDQRRLGRVVGRRRPRQPDSEGRRQRRPRAAASSAGRPTAGTCSPTISTPDLIARGLKTGARIQHLNDFNGSVGGPIVKDKLWYFGSGRHQSTFVQIPNTFKTDGSPGIEDAWIKQLRRPRHVAGDAAEQVRRHLSAQLQVEGARDRERRPDGPADLPGHFRHAARPGALLHRAGEVDVADHEQAARSRSATRATSCTTRACYEPGIAQVRGTPAWFATASHLERDDRLAARWPDSTTSGSIPIRTARSRRCRT